MGRMWCRIVVSGVLCTVSACGPDIEVDQEETLENLPNFNPGPAVEFDPSASVIPFPNNLLIDPATGRLTLPPQCAETPTSTALRENVLNELNGFGTWKLPIRATFEEPVDLASLEGRAFLLRLQTAGSPVAPGSEGPIPLVPIAGTTIRFAGSGQGCVDTAQSVDSVTFVPTVPLLGDSTYGMYLLEGITTTSGETFVTTPTWALVRQSSAPVAFDEQGNIVVNNTPLNPAVPEDLASLQGLSRLFLVNQELLAFGDMALAQQVGEGVPREDILLAWSFNTESIERIFNPGVSGSPAANIATSTPNSMTAAVLGGGANEAVMEGALGPGICDTLPCEAIGTIVAGTFVAPRYQVLDANGIPGPFSDPINPVQQGEETLEFIAFTPIYTTEDEANGAPTILFGHGLGRSKETLFAIGAQLAAAGFNSVAIDWVAHGSRAFQISTDPALGCGGEPDPTVAPQCFAPLLTADLARTRDNVRQSVLDMWKLDEVLKACGTSEDCAGIKVDASRMGYLGQSLGAIIGGIVVGVVPDLSTAVLNVGAVSWVDILENTDTLEIRCPLVDALIDAGVLAGNKWNLGANNTDALCLGETWKTQPGYVSFAATARWVLDPADPVNFVRLLTTGHHILVQEVVGDEVIPNEATAIQGSLLGLTPVPASDATLEERSNGGIPPTPAATSATSAWILYEPIVPTDSADGNMFTHGSLLQPMAGATPAEILAGQLGTAQMQTDAITFLVVNLNPQLGAP